MRDFLIRIGNAEIISGKFAGNVYIYFSEKGINFHFLNSKKVLPSKSIKKITFEKSREEKIIKGSGLAKFFMFWIAFNGQNDSRQLAATYTMGHFANDKKGFQNIFFVNIQTISDFYKIKVNQEQALLIGQAFNNPKEFFNKSLDSRSFDKPILFYQPKTYHWLVYWFFGLGYPLANVDDPSKSTMMVNILLLVIFLPFIFKLISKRVTISKIKKFKESDNYKIILSSF